MFRKAPLEIVKSELRNLTTIFKNTKDTVNKVSNSLLSWSYDSFEANCGLAQTFSHLADLDFAYGQLMQNLCDRTDEYRKAIKDVQEKENDLKQLEARTSKNVKQWHQRIDRIRSSGKAKENGLDLLNLAQRAEDAVNSMKQKQDEFEEYKAKTIHDALIIYTRGCLQIVQYMQIVFQCKTQISELLPDTPVKADQILPDGNRIVQDAFKNVNILALPLRDQAFDRERFHTSVAISQPILQTTTRDLPQKPHTNNTSTIPTSRSQGLSSGDISQPILQTTTRDFPQNLDTIKTSTLPISRSQGLSSGDPNNAVTGHSVHVVTGTNNTTRRLARNTIPIPNGGGVHQLYAKVSKQEKEKPSKPLPPPSAILHVFHEGQSQSVQDTNNNENEEAEQEYADPNEESEEEYAEPIEKEELEYADPLSESDSEPEYHEVDEKIIGKHIQRPTKPPPQRPTKPPSRAHSFEGAQTRTWPAQSKAHSFGTSSDISKCSSTDTPFYAVSSGECGSSEQEDQDGGEIENTYFDTIKGNTETDDNSEIENTYFVDSSKDDSVTSVAVYGNVFILPETNSTIGETESKIVASDSRDTISESHYESTPGDNDDKDTPSQKGTSQSRQLHKSQKTVPDMATEQQEGIPEYENYTFDLEQSQSPHQGSSSTINIGASPPVVKRPCLPVVKKPSPPIVNKPSLAVAKKSSDIEQSQRPHQESSSTIHTGASPSVVKKPSPPIVKKPSPAVAKKSSEAPKPKAKPRKPREKKTPPPVSPRR